MLRVFRVDGDNGAAERGGNIQAEVTEANREQRASLAYLFARRRQIYAIGPREDLPDEIIQPDTHGAVQLDPGPGVLRGYECSSRHIQFELGFGLANPRFDQADLVTYLLFDARLPFD